MNSMTIYNNIQYERLELQRPFDTYTPNVSKSINNHNNNKQNVTVNNRILFYINIYVIFFFRGLDK